MSAPKNIVFDVVGTLASYDNFQNTIENTLGPRFREQGIKIPLFVYLWTEVASREYTNLSIRGHYAPFAQILEATFYRILWKSGVAEPRKLASEEDLATIIQSYSDLEFSADAVECVTKLRDAGFTVWGFTMADPKNVAGFFSKAGFEMEGRVLGCDSSGVGKPDPEAYKPLFQKLKSEGCDPWFGAAHQWDAAAARTVGYRSAFCTAWEGDVVDVVGEVDIVADTLSKMADKVIAASN